MCLQRNLAVMLIGAVVLSVVATMSTPVPASANDTGAFIGGLILGGILGAALDDDDRCYRPRGYAYGYGYVPRGYYVPPPWHWDRDRDCDRGRGWGPRHYDDYRYGPYRDRDRDRDWDRDRSHR